MPSRSVLLVLSAPSGAGKTTVTHALLADNPGLRRVVTCTTRPPRPGERDGVDYHFLTLAGFEERVNRGEFLEHAEVYGHRYGTRREAVLAELRAGHDVVISLDVQGVKSVQQAAAGDAELQGALITVFLTTETLEELEVRLRGRATESDEVIERRLATARREMAEYHRFDYLVISGSRDDDRRRVQAILEAEKLRQSRSGFGPPK